MPKCYYPPNTGYSLERISTPQMLILKKSKEGARNPFGEDFDELKFKYEEIGAGLHITISPLWEQR